MLRKLLGLLLACVAPAVLAQTIYSWKDASGRVHYSDSPPPDAQARSIKQAPLAPRPPTAEGASANTPPNYAEQEVAFRKRRAEAAEAEDKTRKQKASDEQRERDCTQARQQLTGLESGQPVVRFNDAGERIFIDDDERAAEMARSRQYLERSCK